MLILNFISIILPCMITSAEELHISKARKRNEFDNLTVSDISTRMLWIIDNPSKSRCLMDCAKDERCCSFFYNKVTYKCQGHGMTFGSTVLAIAEPNTMYYVLEWGEKYIGDSCLTSPDCVTINSECRDNTCLCVPGYSFSPRRHECLPASDCSSLGSGFSEVIGHAIDGYNEEVLSSVSLQTCLAACIRSTTHVCRSVDYEYSTSNCYLQSATKLTLENAWFTSTDYVYYQRDCD